MDNATLLSTIRKRAEKAVGFDRHDPCHRRREKARDYYNGRKFGDEREGYSQVVSRDVADAIEGIMPSLMKIFAAGDEVVRFNPVGPEDEATARQATDYINHVFTSRNPGFRILYTWFKDALLYGMGIVKASWREEETSETSFYDDLAGAEECALLDDPDIVRSRKIPASDKHPARLEVTRRRRSGRIVIEPMPPGEFLYSADATDIATARFVAHRVFRSRESLEADWPGKREAIRQLFPQHDDDGDAGEGEAAVPLHECYTRIDHDGDGIPELRMITIAGEDFSLLLENQPVGDNPFAVLSPVLETHALGGRSFFDELEDIQRIKSTLWRQALDALYLANNPMTAIDPSTVNIDDLLTRRIGGLVRVRGNPGASIMPMPNPAPGMDPFAMIEYCDSVRETRVGITRYNQGLDADTLNKTATGVSMIQSASQQRIELVARVFAETGVRRLFEILLRLARTHQIRQDVIRLRGVWVPMEPSAWKAQFDLSVTVGIGAGNREQQMAVMMQLLRIDDRIVAMQGGTDGPLVTAENIHAKLKRLAEAAGLRDSGRYYTAPSSGSAPPPPPPPAPPPRPEALLDAERARIQLAKEHIGLEEKEIGLERERLRLLAEEARTRRTLHETGAELADTSLSEPVFPQVAAPVPPHGGE